jgi:hypothetical protein
MMNKKGSLELSIQTIVIVVIAFSVLGLGLTFVRQQFSDIGDTTVTIQEQVKQQILDDLRTGNKKLSFPSNKMDIGKGESEDIAFGVKNTLNDELNYMITIKVKKMEGSTLTEADLKDEVTFFYDDDKYSLPATESRVHSIKVSAPGDKGTYLVKLSILDSEMTGEDNVYDEKTFFVTIK